MSSESGISVAVTDALLRAAAARGRRRAARAGRVRLSPLRLPALLEVVTANGGALRALRLCYGAHGGAAFGPTASMLRLAGAEALLRAAPALRVLDADLLCESVAEARRALRADANVDADADTDSEGLHSRLLAPARARPVRLHRRRHRG